MPTPSQNSSPAAKKADFPRALTPIEISVALIAGAGGFALFQALGLFGVGGA